MHTHEHAILQDQHKLQIALEPRQTRVQRPADTVTPPYPTKKTVRVVEVVE